VDSPTANSISYARPFHALLHGYRKRRLENLIAVVKGLHDDVVLSWIQTYVGVDLVSVSAISNNTGRAIDDRTAVSKFELVLSVPAFSRH
jgi:hypothetical protein